MGPSMDAYTCVYLCPLVCAQLGLCYMRLSPVLVSYLVFVGALVFEFVAPPLDQILTTPKHLCMVPRDTY